MQFTNCSLPKTCNPFYLNKNTKALKNSEAVHTGQEIWPDKNNAAIDEIFSCDIPSDLTWWDISASHDITIDLGNCNEKNVLFWIRNKRLFHSQSSLH